MLHCSNFQTTLKLLDCNHCSLLHCSLSNELLRRDFEIREQMSSTPQTDEVPVCFPAGAVINCFKRDLKSYIRDS